MVTDTVRPDKVADTKMEMEFDTQAVGSAGNMAAPVVEGAVVHHNSAEYKANRSVPPYAHSATNLHAVGAHRYTHCMDHTR